MISTTTMMTRIERERLRPHAGPAGADVFIGLSAPNVISFNRAPSPIDTVKRPALSVCVEVTVSQPRPTIDCARRWKSKASFYWDRGRPARNATKSRRVLPATPHHKLKLLRYCWARNAMRNSPRIKIRSASIFCTVVFLLVPSVRIQAQDLLPELVRRIKPSAVAIETFDSRGEKLSRGSGFFIDADRVVTNRHVIDNAFRAEVHSYNGSIYQVKGVIAVDAEGDLALLRVDAPPNQVRPLVLDKTSPQEGESVVVIGNPLGLEGSVTNGIVSAVRDIPTFGRIIQITAPISPGSSGSRSSLINRIERQSGCQHARSGDRRGHSASHRRPKRQLRHTLRKNFTTTRRHAVAVV